MSLQKILLRISSDLGINITTESELTWAIAKVNEISKKLYDSKDIKDSLREFTFNIDSGDEGPMFSSQVSLPYYVGNLRGVRFSQVVGGKVPLNDMRPRYSNGKGWGANSFTFPYRITREDAPIEHDIVNASVLTFSIEQPEADDIVIIVVGKTTKASRIQEIVTLVAGDTSVSCVGNYEDVFTIEKQSYCSQDITVTDVEDNIISVIPNNFLSPYYTWVELTDANALISGAAGLSGQLSAIDILYKERYYPFVNLYDEFVCRSCDDVIFWLFASWYASQTPGQELRVALADKEANSLMSNILIDSEESKTMEMQFGNNGLLEIQQPFRGTSPSFGFVSKLNP